MFYMDYDIMSLYDTYLKNAKIVQIQGLFYGQ